MKNPASQTCSIFSRNPIARDMLVIVLFSAPIVLGFAIWAKIWG